MIEAQNSARSNASSSGSFEFVADPIAPRRDLRSATDQNHERRAVSTPPLAALSSPQKEGLLALLMRPAALVPPRPCGACQVSSPGFRLMNDPGHGSKAESCDFYRTFPVGRGNLPASAVFVFTDGRVAHMATLIYIGTLGSIAAAMFAAFGLW